MKIRLGKVNALLLGLRKLEKNIFTAKLSYAISYNIEKLETVSRRIEKQRIKCCENYCMKDDSGEPVKETVKKSVNGQVIETEQYVFEDDKQNRGFKKEYEELLEQEEEIDIRKVKQELLDLCYEDEKYTTPSVETVNALFFMMEE